MTKTKTVLSIYAITILWIVFSFMIGYATHRNAENLPIGIIPLVVLSFGTFCIADIVEKQWKD